MDLERELRDVLTSERRTLPTSLVPLERVHARAARRRTRRRVAVGATALVAAVAVAVPVGVGFGTGPDRAPVADTSPTPTASESPGPTPSESPSPASGLPWDNAHVTSVTATSTRTFVVLGAVIDTGDCGRADCLRLAESHDGGETFSSLPVPDDAAGVHVLPDRSTATDVRFGSAQDGWLFGDGLWSTHDGGHSWARLSTPGRVTRLASAAGTAWALVPKGGYGDTQQLWRSAVGADAWSRVPGVSVTGPGDLAVQGDRVVVVGAADSPVWVGGPDGFDSYDGPCSGALAADLSAVGSFWVKCVTGTLARLAVSRDGASWTDVPLTTGLTSGNGAVPNNAALGARTDNEALVGMGVDPVLTRVSADGTLSPLPDLPPRDGAQATYVGFTTPDVGYAILTSGLYRTDDGGNTWRKLVLG
jgi:photosystem II stability/assembly factor-like uncharacterized protein